MSEKKQHFVLVHGPSHGAWYWHKVKPILEASGYRVTALNLTASGINVTKSITQVFSCEQYTEPLLEFMRKLQSDEKVVLLSHSTGGISASIAMEMFPDKISVSVFVSAFMPDTKNSPGFVVDKFKRETPDEAWLGSEFVPYGTEGVSMSLSYEFLKQAMYNLCSVEDLELTLLTKRPGSLFINELLKADNFTEKGYGSVPRAYIVNKEDLATTETYQRWMIDNYPPSLVVEMDKADHIPLVSWKSRQSSLKSLSIFLVKMCLDLLSILTFSSFGLLCFLFVGYVGFPFVLRYVCFDFIVVCFCVFLKIIGLVHERVIRF